MKEVSVKTTHTCDKCGTKLISQGDLRTPPENWASLQLNYYGVGGTSAQFVELHLCQRCANSVEFFATTKLDCIIEPQEIIKKIKRRGLK